MKLALDWLTDRPYLNEDLVKNIQADALAYAATTIQDACDAGVQADSAIALVRIKAGNLKQRK